MFWRIFLGSVRGRRRSVLLAAAAMAVGTAAVAALLNVGLGMRGEMREELRGRGATGVILPGISSLGGGGDGTLGLLPQTGRLPGETWARLVDRLGGSGNAGGPGAGLERVLYAAGKLDGDPVVVVGQDRAWGDRPAGPPYPIERTRDDGAVHELKLGDRTVEARVESVKEQREHDAAYVGMELAHLQAAGDLPGAVSAIRFHGGDDEALLARVRTVVGELLPGWTVQTVRQTVEAERALLGRLELVMTLVAAGVLVGSALAVMATMLSTVLDRRQEIGLFLALGGGARLIRAQFLLEGALAGVLGGVVGLVLGWAGSWGIGRSVFGASLGLSPLAAASALGICLVASVLAVRLPLRRALRLDPRECLTAAD